MKIFKGKVIAKKDEKTATVAVTTLVAHPVYKKRFKRTKKFQVHDEVGSQNGDKVLFAASRPYSKLKKWKITKIVKEKKK